MKITEKQLREAVRKELKKRVSVILEQDDPKDAKKDIVFAKKIAVALGLDKSKAGLLTKAISAGKSGSPKLKEPLADLFLHMLDADDPSVVGKISAVLKKSAAGEAKTDDNTEAVTETE